jgi:BirA family biotin operon repressor/biotin-[acetyl-CoA-carboxylase] ligase
VRRPLHLPERPHLRYLPETGSTNLVACEWARAGGPDGACVVADAQTAGRGRLGRRWCSPPGVNLYCSLILRPPEAALGLAPLAGGLATREAVAACLPPEFPAMLKWPNDVRVRGLKLAGVLAVLVADCEPRAVVVGVGLNVNMRPDQFPPDLRQPAGSLAMLLGHELDRTACLAALLEALDAWRTRLGADPGSIVPAFAARCETLGQRVRLKRPGAPALEGLARGLAPGGELELRDDAGQVHLIAAGDLAAPAFSPGRS